MPYVWQDNPEYFTHNGVTIYRLYKDDDAGQGTRSFWYATSPEGSDTGGGENGEFDVRDLKAAEGRPVREVDVLLGDDSTIRAIICAAIDAGELPFVDDEDDDSDDVVNYLEGEETHEKDDADYLEGN